MPSFNIITFGCQMNVNDSDWLTRSLLNKKFTLSDKNSADFVIINTCSVREKPEHKVHSLIGEVRIKNKKAKMIIVGCLAQQLGKVFFQKYPEVKLVIGTDHFTKAPDLIEDMAENSFKKRAIVDFNNEYPERDLYLELLEHKSPLGSVNIMQGCDNFCAYCIVPYVRGNRKSRKSADIIQECLALTKIGVRDITLLGQNVNVYGKDLENEISFVELLYELEKLPKLEIIRLMSSHPKDFSDEMIEAYGKINKIAPRLHLPMQSGSNNILKSMRRGYTLEQYIELTEKLRKARPEIVFSSDLIIGFPGETEEDFQQTLALVEKVPFIMSYSFCYSDRPGTLASKMLGKIDRKTQLERLERLQSKQSPYFTAYLATLVGQEYECIIEKITLDSNIIIYDMRNVFDISIHASTQNIALQPSTNDEHLTLTKNSYQIGQKVLVKIINSKRHSLIGEIVKVL